MENENEIIITEEDVAKRIQSAEDKLRTNYSKQIKEYEDKIKELAPIQKSESEIELEKRLKLLEDKEKAIQQKEKELTISDKLKEQGLPSQLSKYLIGAEDVETEINSLKDIFNSNVLDNSFKPTNHKATEGLTKEQFKKMNYAEKMKLYKEDKTLYDILSK